MHNSKILDVLYNAQVMWDQFQRYDSDDAQ
jgi:hypothetical protein